MNIIEIIAAILTICVVIFLYWIHDKMKRAIEYGDERDRSEKARQDQAARDVLAETVPTKQATNSMEQKKGTRDLFLETLTKIGCQYDFGQGEDDRIHFAYQGEHFLVAADNERPYVFIYDYAWHSVELFNIDEVSRLRKAINEANWQNSVTTVFSIDKEGQTMDVHCKATILFIPGIPDLAEYLKVELNEFFHAHQLVGSELAKLRTMESVEK